VFDYGRQAFVVVTVVVFASLLVLHRPRLVEAFLDALEAIPLVGKLRPRLDEAYVSMRRLIDWKLMSWTTLLSIVGWSMEAFAFYLILQELGAETATFSLAAFVFAMTTILGAVTFLPGGLGVTEGSMIGVLMVMGVVNTEAAAGAATYLIRFATLWFGVLVGLLALLWYRFNQQA
ncbi:MAG: lysylphosphatidylglycerol synthase transmembrane domain-containing protein, partial [Persicimonas sp.]